MDALVVYESIYGNTRAVAEAIADGVGAFAVLPVHAAQGSQGTPDLLIIGGPTHVHGLATRRSRHVAAATAQEDGRTHLEAGATTDPGLRTWLHGLSPGAARHAAAFDTRLDRSPWLSGAAARGITRRLRHLGIDVIATESFLVEDTEGPLQAGELERARAWGAELARSLPVPHKQLVETEP